jgi:hypothetical protein
LFSQSSIEDLKFTFIWSLGGERLVHFILKYVRAIITQISNELVKGEGRVLKSSSMGLLEFKLGDESCLPRTK